MEGTAPSVAPMNNNGVSHNTFVNNSDMISFESDSSGDSKLESKFSTTTPHRRIPSDHREDVPLDSPPRRSSHSTRRRALTYQEDRSPLSWYYSQGDNSPSVSSVTPRKSLTSWVDAILNAPNTQQQRSNEGYYEDDVSLDSVEELEQVAMRIRSEIRQLELKELADEAESAAEAGHERFAGRASTFGDSSHSLSNVDLNDVDPKQHYRLRRFSTYSEGTSLLQQAALRPVRSKPKIRCLQLRDINEVIPRMEELHAHLKTHFLLAGVERSCLEVPAVVEKEETVDDNRARAVKTPVQFLNSLKSWVSTTPSRSSAPQSPSTDVASNVTTPRRSTVDQCKKGPTQTAPEECETSVATIASQDSYEVGGRLSGHLHEPKAVQRSPIRIPKGLDLPDDLGILHEVPNKIMLNDCDGADVDTVDTVPTSSSSQQDEACKENHEMEHFTPIALFEHLEEDTDSTSKGGGSCGGSSRNSMLATSPTVSVGERLSDVIDGTNMFVTPMRLRGIRRASRQLAFERQSLRHKSADLGWTFKGVKQRRATSELQIPKESLEIPILSVKSDGDCSPIARLNRSKDTSVMSLPEDFGPGEISFSMSDPIMRTSGNAEVLLPDIFREWSRTGENSQVSNRSFVASQHGDNQHAGKSNTTDETAHVTIPKIDQRPVCEESVQIAIPEIEINNDSFHSLVLDQVFATESSCFVNDDASNEAQPSACAKGVTDDAAHLEIEPSCLASTGPERSTTISGYDAAGRDHVAGWEARVDTDPISAFYANELTMDDGAAADENADERIQSEKTYDVDNPEDGTILMADDIVLEIAAEQLSIEVNELNDSSSEILHHLLPAHEDCSPQARFQKREEIVRSPSRRVRVIIERSLHEESDTDDDDDDDVRSEATSAHTPQQGPCECLINCATQFEKKVSVDIAKASGCARIRCDLPSANENDAVAAHGKDPVEAALPASAYSQPEEIMPSVPSRLGSGGQKKWSPIRRTLSCPSMLKVTKETNEAMSSSFTIPHKSVISEAASPVSAISDLTERRRRTYFRASTVLDPCQSTSPFKETMDDMMKSFSSKRLLQEEMKLIAQAQENHEFLNNFLYCSKPPDKQQANGGSKDGIMCGEHCDYFSGILDAYRSLVPSTSKKDMLSLNAVDTSLPPSATTETWFDVASEHFDGALEALMGRAHEESRRWNSMFRAPGLKSRKHQSHVSGTQDSDVKGIVLVKQTNTVDSRKGDLSEHQFELMYGMKREEFAQLPVTERSIMHDLAFEKRRHWTVRAKANADVEPPSPAVSVRSLSSSDLWKMAD